MPRFGNSTVSDVLKMLIKNNIHPDFCATRQVFTAKWLVDWAVANKMNLIFHNSFAVLQVVISACFFFYPVQLLICVR